LTCAQSNDICTSVSPLNNNDCINNKILEISSKNNKLKPDLLNSENNRNQCKRKMPVVDGKPGK
jgi:hypothetical protein